ncbi:hypothetical protein Hanom_Chr16g01489321 [Helianthus anomalus]
MRAADNTRGIDMNCMKERSSEIQRLAEALKEKHDYMKEWDHDSEDPGNPDPSATLEQPPATTSSQLVVLKDSQLGSSQGTSSGAVEEQQQLEISSYIESSMSGTSSVPSTTYLALQAVHPNIEEIVFEGETNKSTYVRADGMDFDPFDEEWMKENQEDIDEQLKNRTSSDNPTDSFQEWRKRFLSKVEKPTPSEAQVDFLQFEKVKPHGKILSWMFVKEIHYVVIKREHGIQYFNSMLSILSLPFYGVAALSKLDIINLRTEERVEG